MTRICGIIFWATAWFWVSCTSYPRIPASGVVAGNPIITAVDSNLAKQYLETGLGGRGQNPKLGNQNSKIDARNQTAIVESNESEIPDELFGGDQANQIGSKAQ